MRARPKEERLKREEESAREASEWHSLQSVAQGWKSGSSSALRGGCEGEVIFAHSRLGGKAEDGAGVNGRGVCPQPGGEGEGVKDQGRRRRRERSRPRGECISADSGQSHLPRVIEAQVENLRSGRRVG